MESTTLNDTLYMAHTLLPVLYFGLGCLILASILERIGKRGTARKNRKGRAAPRSIIVTAEPTTERIVVSRTPVGRCDPHIGSDGVQQMQQPDEPHTPALYVIRGGKA